MLVTRPPEVGGGNTTDDVTRTESSHSKVQEPGSSIDTGDNMQKILRSPASMKKKATSKIFGVPLRELGHDASGVKVPDLIKKVSDFIQMHGIGHEGIFRVNGSSRVVDNLKTQFDRNGDADLEEAEDVMAVASLLKLFLRELPDPVMTEHLHQNFISIQEEYRSDRSECVNQLKLLLTQLPEENYLLLQYIISFLVKVSKYEDTNKMSSQALAIVFGPNLFRCSEGLQGLREQGITNSIVRNLIEEYHRLFLDKDSMETEMEQPRRGSSGSSKRIQVQAATSERSPPVIKRRGIKKRVVEEDVKDYNSNSYSDTDREEQRRGEKEPEDKSTSDHSNHSTLSTGLLSPRDLLSGGEERSFSPFNLDSDNGTSAAPSPVINDITSEVVEQTIKQSVTQHLFGQEERTESPVDETPIPSPRRRRQEKKKQRALQEVSKLLQDNNNRNSAPDGASTSTTDVFPSSSVQDRIRHFSDSGQPPGSPGNNSSSSPEYSPSTKKKLHSSSKAFELFESQGIVIAPKDPQSKSSNSSSSVLNGSKSSEGSDTSPVVKPRRKAPEAPARPYKNNKSPSTGSPSSGSPSNGSPNSGSPRSRSPRSKSPKLSNMRLIDDKRSVSPSEGIAIGDDLAIDGQGEDLGSVKRNSPALKSLTSGRAPPPKNRRSPSRKSRLKEGSDTPVMLIDNIEPIQIAQEIPMEESSPPPPPPDVLPTGSIIQNTKETGQPQPKPRKKKSKSKSQGSNGQHTRMESDAIMNSRNLDVESHQLATKSPPRWRAGEEKTQHHRNKDEHIHLQQQLRTDEKERRHRQHSGEDRQPRTPVEEDSINTSEVNPPQHHHHQSEEGGGHHHHHHHGDEQGHHHPHHHHHHHHHHGTEQGHGDNNGNRQRHVPPLDLASLLEHGDGTEPIPVWQNQPHLEPNPDEAVLSPRSGLKIQAVVNDFQHAAEGPNWYEAPLSPRAKDLPYSFSSISNNTEIPPSPPSSQQLYMSSYCPSKRAEKHGEEDVSSTKQLTRQIRSLKRKIRQFEDEFEKEKGYKPSHIDKSSQPEIKKMMGELKRANKQLKEAKEAAAQAKVPLHSTLPARAKRNLSDDFGDENTTHLDIMREALQQAHIRIEEKRIEANRPVDLNQMDRQQVQEEKTAIQKALLHLENRFGRPSTKETKELMKPLYDRYRNLKKLIAKFEIRHATEETFNPALDLQTIEEHKETKEFKPKQLMNPLNSDPPLQGEVHSKYRNEDDEEEMGTTDFAVTQDLSLMKNSAPPHYTEYDEGYPSPDGNGRRDSRDSMSPATLDLIAPNLHEASVVELIASQNQAKDDKRRLRKVLKEFEDNFFQETGRRVQREDRTPMESEYNEYKHLKQQLKLLDALIAKHYGSMQTTPLATI